MSDEASNADGPAIEDAELEDAPAGRLNRDVLAFMSLHSPRGPLSPDRPAFHYTGADATSKIVMGQTLRLTNAAYLNDPAELKYPMGLAEEVFAKVLQGTDDEQERLLLEVTRGAISERQGVWFWYLMSFSRDGDSLSQWRAYCPHGGYALGFDPDLLSSLAWKNGCVVGDVEYDRAKQVALLETEIRRWLEYARILRAQEAHAECAEIDFYTTISHALWVALSLRMVFFKHFAFRSEVECRLVTVRTTEPSGFFPRNGLPTPYVDLSPTAGSRLPLSQVLLGPHVDAELAEHSVQLLLKPKYPALPVTRSAFSLRLP
jgi:hypothetical protein